MRKTPLFDLHEKSGAKIVEFGGWLMPVQYETGIVQEHLATRREAGLFDVSHMGRFVIGGENGLAFLQHVLTNNAAAQFIRDVVFDNKIVKDDVAAFRRKFTAMQYSFDDEQIETLLQEVHNQL